MALRRRLPAVLWIAVVWVALWGDVSWANVLGGLLAGAVLVTLVPLPPSRGGYRVAPWPALVLLVRFLRDLAVATWQVSVQVFWPLQRLRTGIVLVQLAGRDPAVTTLVANFITLTPGTLTLEVDEDGGRLWVHCLHLDEGHEQDIEDDARDVERLAARMLGVRLEEVAR